VLPTRNARRGTVFISTGRLVVKNAAYAADARPLDPACDCAVCQRFSRAYLRHLFASGEMLAMRLASLHAVSHMVRLAREARAAVLEGRFGAFRETFLERFESGETLEPRSARRARAARRRVEDETQAGDRPSTEEMLDDVE